MQNIGKKKPLIYYPAKVRKYFCCQRERKGEILPQKKSPANKGVSIPLFAGHGLFVEHRLFHIQKISIFRPKARERMSVSVTRLLGTADTT